MCREETEAFAACGDYVDTVIFMKKTLIKENLIKCNLCPRRCNVNRLSGQTGVCGMTGNLKVSRAALHMWEEPCISGSEGSGTVFFSGCPLKCVFCQNADISRGNIGKEITVERLSDIFLELQEKGANNINLVTPTHYVPEIVEAAKIARSKGLTLPFVYNTGSYENPDTLEILRGIVDVFLPDLKYLNSNTAMLFSKASDYPEVAKTAIAKMFSIVGACEFDSRGMIKKGLIVRVLVLPAHTNEAIEIIKYLYETYHNDIYISIMSQYTPLSTLIPDQKEYDCLKRSLTKREYKKVVDAALDMGVTNAFFQEGGVNKESFIPPFDYEGV